MRKQLRHRGVLLDVTPVTLETSFHLDALIDPLRSARASAPLPPETAGLLRAAVARPMPEQLTTD